MGYDVTHVSAPVSPGHLIAALGDEFIRSRVSRWWRGGVVVDGVRELVPFTWLPWVLARRSEALWLAYSRTLLVTPSQTFAVSELAGAQCLIVDEPRFAGLVSRTRCNVIYRATDLYAELRNDPKIIDAEKLMCERAQVLVATSEPVARHLSSLSGKTVSVITNGVDFERFAGSTESAAGFSLPGSRAQRAVYVGSFDVRFSRSALQRAARALPDKHFVLAGPGSQSVAEELALQNVLGLGPVPYSRVPVLLQQCAVGLLPLASGAANDGRSPMKLYEYAAAGMTIAAMATAELTRRALSTLCACSSEEEFPGVVAAAFDLSVDSNRIAEARELARSHSWIAKAKELLALIGDATATSTISPVSPISRSVIP
jgi:teichuronic acid biosynthesis glycosyltransferase TuaH